ncbi:MAG: aminopeptidase P family protein [Armatimonadetes bacterium]|nr:aminopeptidase P family protein [Armatimonadota bacterium]
MTRRIHRLREVMTERDLPAMLITRPQNVGYLTGFTGSTAALVVTAAEAVFITDARYVEQARAECAPLPVVPTQTGHTYGEKIAEVAHGMGITTLGLESDYLTLRDFDKLREELEGIALRPEAELVSGLRVVKDAGEIERIRRACALVDATFEHILTLVHPGVRERDLAIEIECFMKKRGAEREGFDTIVASGVRAALPHGRASNKPIEAGDLVIFDFGATLNSYSSDLTRTMVVGQASERQRDIYAIVREAQAAAIAAIRPGVEAKQVDATARDLIAARGYGEQFGHGLGHSLGREVHDGPGLSPRSEFKLEAGMVFTVEPGIYIQGWGGVRIEDDVVVTKHGCDVLTTSPRELLELSP